MANGVVTLPLSDYARLLEAAEADTSLIWCEQCGAWLDHTEGAVLADFTGCWFAATGREKDRPTCRRYRAPATPAPERERDNG